MDSNSGVICGYENNHGTSFAQHPRTWKNLKWHRYTPPPENDPASEGNNLESTNFENTILFVISCFQYILVAAVFSIGPPYRRSMWTNGALRRATDISDKISNTYQIAWLMFSMVVLSAFNMLVLLAPPKPIQEMLTLIMLPLSARITLLIVVASNVAVSMAFEQWGSRSVGSVMATVLQKWWQGRRRMRKGKLYKIVESGMR